MIKIGICGAKGRMGREIQNCLEAENKAFEKTFENGKNFAASKKTHTKNSENSTATQKIHAQSKSGANSENVAVLGGCFDKGGNLGDLFANSSVIIDFSASACTADLLKFAINSPKPLLIGTTGLDSGAKALMQRASEQMPLFYATNMSLGVAVLNHLARQAAAALQGFDIEIVEMHHRHKKDAPSGTAMTLAETAAKARNLKLSSVRVSSRDGLVGERTKDEIAVMSLRGGDIVGRHTVGFYDEGEFVELTHTATSRATFARGALKIAKWLVSQKNGFYGMSDFLGI